MNDSNLQALFSGKKGLVLISENEFASAPSIDLVRPGAVSTYPAGWVALSATSSENLISLDMSQGETDPKKFDDLDTFCVARQYISLGIAQVSMTQEVFTRTFGAGQWDSSLRAYRAEGRISASYRSMLVLFFGPVDVMAVYFSRVKILPGEKIFEVPKGYFMEIPLAGFVQEPAVASEGKYVVYAPRKKAL